MGRITPRSLLPAARAILAISAALLCLMTVQAQFPRGPFGPGGMPRGPFGPGGMPRPPMPGGPHFKSVWKCSRCGHVLGEGSQKPALTSCPYCGARFINGTGPFIPPQGGGNPAPNNPVVPPPSNPPAQPNNPGIIPQDPPAPPGDALRDPPAANPTPPGPLNGNESRSAQSQPATPPTPSRGLSVSTQVKIVLGLAAVLAALVLAAVAGIVVYNMVVRNAATADEDRPRRRRRRTAEVD
jgi:DNA-directed RNA polymerase subunit RPC12/RpoP